MRRGSWLRENWDFCMVLLVLGVLMFILIYALLRWVLPLPRGGA